MARLGYLYRRSSGIYIVRICVPQRLKHLVGRGEIHLSTGARDPTTAKASAFRILSIWQQRVIDLDRMNLLNITNGSPLLSGVGQIRLTDVAQMFEIDANTLLLEVANNKIPLLCIANCWSGYEVDDIDKVERDFDGSFLQDSKFDGGQSKLINGQLIMFDTLVATQSFLESGQYSCGLFFRDSKRRRAVFFYDEQSIGINSVLLHKSDVERIRLSLGRGIPPKMLEEVKGLMSPSIPTSSPLSFPVPPKHKNETRLTSELLAEFLLEKKIKGRWKNETYQRMSSICGVFVELMDDPMVGSLDRAMIRSYHHKLLTLPVNIYQARRSHGIDSLKDLIMAAESTGEQTMLVFTANKYVRCLSEMFKWSVTEELMPRNPAEGYNERRKMDSREQDDRNVFDNADLAKIFEVNWFRDGKGELSANGRYHNYQPHYYWLPLLSLYSGGRLNELAQLNLNDVLEDTSGHWYLDFNFNDPHKKDLDPKQDPVQNGAKSFKTINSIRIVALHKELIRLGLPAYVKALREAGHTRLFPELSFDVNKGYGKAAGSWFNERFLGKRLEIARDGRKVFHSFRHTFTNALFAAEIPEVTAAQLVGHERGYSQAAIRYRKDQEASELQGYIDRLKFELPTIAPFDIAAGIKAVEDALKRKERNRREKEKSSADISTNTP